MHCPLCQKPLAAIRYEGALVHTCNHCGGEFIGPDDLTAIINQREAIFGAALRELCDDHQPMFGVPADADQRDLDCPACEGCMQLVNYGGDSGIAVDRCDTCGGVWLDHDELEKIQIIMEKWKDQAPFKLNEIAAKLEQTRQQTAASVNKKFTHSRFSFVNAVINRLLDAA
jgi:Zn-finger nucleic acid-binding protein